MALRHSAMLQVNEFLVLDYVREHGDTTRPEIAHALGLSASSVSRLIARLVAEGLVRESGASPSAAGRPRSRISFNPLAGCILALDLGGTRCHFALADLAGEILLEDERPTRGAGEPFETLLAAIATLRSAAAEQHLPVAAVAVGVPAIVDPATGRAVAGPRVDWQDFEIVGRLREVLDVPFVVENDVNLAALAHAWRGEARGVDDFVVLSVGTGIGGAVVAGGRLVKGHHNAGGEIGYLTVERQQLDEPIERGLGGLEELASGPAIARRAHEARSRRAAADRAESSLSTAEAVFAAAASGDADAAGVVRDAVDRLSLAITAIAATVDPALVILEGSVGRSLEPYLPLIRDRLARRLPMPPAAVVSRLASATVVGAVAAALQLARERRAPGALSGTFRDVDRAGSVRAPTLVSAAGAAGADGSAGAGRSDLHA